MRSNTGKGEMHVLAAVVKLLAGIFVCAALVSSTALAQNSPPVITFDAPGAGAGSYQGTIATAISAAGVIAGYYFDSNWGCHGFVRNSDGTFISFDTPSRQLGAPTCPQPASFNAAGVITGAVSDPSFGCTAWSQSDQNPEGCGGNHGFIRMPDGRITVFDGPVNPSFANPSTGPKNISSTGAIVGQYYTCDQSGCSTSFLRSPGGAFSTFAPPGLNPGGISLAVGILANGSIAGYFTDDNWITHGYLRAADGSFTVIDAPGAVLGTWIWAINSQGEVIGDTEDANYQGHPYLRTSDGTFTGIDVPNGVSTRPAGINNAGTIVGTFATATTSGPYTYHIFLRAADGTFTAFDAPSQSFTVGSGISSSNAVVGNYQDANGVYHGFLRPGNAGN